MIFTLTQDQALDLFSKQQHQVQTLQFLQQLQVEQLIPSRSYHETSLEAAQVHQTTL